MNVGEVALASMNARTVWALLACDRIGPSRDPYHKRGGYRARPIDVDVQQD
jgi:hypothetical protein